MLETIEPQQGANQNIRAGSQPKVTRTTAAREAGMAERQQKTAMRIARIPSEEFEELVESYEPLNNFDS